MPGKVGMQKIGAGRLMGTILMKLYWAGPLVTNGKRSWSVAYDIVAGGGDGETED